MARISTKMENNNAKQQQTNKQITTLHILFQITTTHYRKYHQYKIQQNAQSSQNISTTKYNKQIIQTQHNKTQY